MDTIELQKFIFDEKPNRMKLLDYKSCFEPKYKVSVYRNHSFELVEHTISAYLDYAGMGISFEYSDYDDSLSFFDLDEKSDALLLWLDMTRYHDVNPDFFTDRLVALRGRYNKPVLVVPFEGNIELPKDNEFFGFNLDDIKQELGIDFVDEAKEKYTGTKLGAKACLRISKELGLKWLPAILRPAIKAIVVDMDNTLYKGVLGEDGKDGIILTPAHRKLQEQLKKYAKEGFFLCAASKNEETDVIEMLKGREDFPLKQEDFTKLCVSWNDKAQSIFEISKFLNIGTDSMVFIDDNVGELFAVKSAIPNIKEIMAYEDAEKTIQVLTTYPGMLRLGTNREDKLRSDDVKANEMRNKLHESMSQEEYIKTLEIELDYAIDSPKQAQRVYELANKTNQFICNYKRYQLSEVNSLMMSEKSTVVTVSLKDKLSDSGLICVCAAKQVEDYIEIEEMFVSCRALGRGIDDFIIKETIEIICDTLSCRRVKIDFQKGERNMPAEKYLDEELGEYKNNVSEYSYNMQQGIIKYNITRG